MGIMDRLSRLLRANVNDMLDRAEDPEKMLDQVLRSQSRTEGRLEALGDLQRGLYLVGLDTAMAQGRSMAGSGGAVTFLRSGGVGVGYALRDGRYVDGRSRAMRRECADP